VAGETETMAGVDMVVAGIIAGAVEVIPVTDTGVLVVTVEDVIALDLGVSRETGETTEEREATPEGDHQVPRAEAGLVNLTAARYSSTYKFSPCCVIVVFGCIYSNTRSYIGNFQNQF